MSDNQSNINKLRHQNKLLEAENNAIKNSRTYRLLKTAAVIKNKVREDPVKATRKALGLVLRRPGRLLRLIRGREANSALQDIIQNRLANYHAWIVLNEPSDEDLAEQRLSAQKLAKKPLISIITPVFDPPVDVLEDLIESVLNQTYPYFELCLGNFGGRLDVKELLSKYAHQDNRIKVHEFSENKGIAENSNMILQKAEGDYIALLDHDDTISPDALYENALLINKDNCDFIYSDKDMINEQGDRYDPMFKPGWSPEIMLSANYPTHFNVMRTSIVREVGGWDSATDGAQDWDLFLKVAHASKKIGHVPKVLYHWRVIATSTAHSIDTKPYALEGQRRAVQKYLDKEGIAAKPYHRKTELLLNWDASAVDSKPLVIVRGRTVSSTLRLLGRLRHELPAEATYVVAYSGNLPPEDKEIMLKSHATKVYQYPAGSLARKLNEIITAHSDRETVLFIDDLLKLPNKWNYKDLAGWLSIKAVAMVGGKVMGRDDMITDCGAVLTPAGPMPIFRGYPSYYQGYIGNVEWVRNLRVVSRQLFMAKMDTLRQLRFNESLSDEAALVAAMIMASKKQRLVMCPKVVAYTVKDLGEAPRDELAPICKQFMSQVVKSNVDTFCNPNVSAEDPMRLNLNETGAKEDSPTESEAVDQYQHDALILTRLHDLSQEDIGFNRQLGDSHSPIAINSVGWFMPGFDAIYAGLNNIFGFAEYLASQGAKTHFFIMRGDAGVQAEHDIVIKQYPGLKNAKFVSISSDKPDATDLDVGICTQWASAFPLAKLRNVKRKCYFIQDRESNFYPQGSVSALVDLTYELNFFAIANTQGLLDFYKQNGGRGTLLKSIVDINKWHPREELYFTSKKPYRVFFYARPNMPRNAFELGLAGLAKLKEQLGKDVEIITAGASWDPQVFGYSGVVTNLNKIPYDEVPKFYRTLDAGMMFMFSGHPGVTASELMASGCPVVVNDYDDVTWHELYRHEKTCLITTPTASEIARNLRRCLEDQALRKVLIKGGLEAVKQFYAGYSESQHKAKIAIEKG